MGLTRFSCPTLRTSAAARTLGLRSCLCRPFGRDAPARHPHHLFSDAFGLLLKLVSRLIHYELRLNNTGQKHPMKGRSSLNLACTSAWKQRNRTETPG